MNIVLSVFLRIRLYDGWPKGKFKLSRNSKVYFDIQSLFSIPSLNLGRYYKGFEQTCDNFNNSVMVFESVKQSHYREVPRWEIFMEQKLRFGLDLGRMADFPAFIASRSFDLWNHHVSEKCFWYIWHILMYQKHIKFRKNTSNFL